jgi:hypothetical protein
MTRRERAMAMQVEETKRMPDSHSLEQLRGERERE